MRRAVVFVVALALSCGDDSNSLNGGSGGTSGSSGDTSSSGGSSGSSGSSGTGTPTGLGKTCADTINAYRKQQGLPAYQEWTDIETCSDSEAKSDGTTGTAHGAFPKCGEFAQNECPGWPGPTDTGIVKCLDTMWALGPGEGHHDNMASTQWTKVACGFYTKPDGSFWSVQNFH